MAKPQRVTYLKTTLEDRPGALLEVARHLKEKNVNLTAMWGFATREGRADLFVIAKSPDKLRSAWKAEGRAAEEGTAFLVRGADKTGAMVKMLEALAGAGVNLMAMNGVTAGGNYGTVLWVAPADVEKTASVLGAK